MGRIEVICGLLTGAVCAIFYIGTLSFPKSSIGINPRAYPLVIIFSAFALSVTLIVRGALNMRSEKRPRERTLPHGKTAWFLIILAAGMMAYALSLETLGYIVVTPLLMALAMYLFGERKPFRIILTSVLVSIMLYWLFRSVFRVPLPRSIIW